MPDRIVLKKGTVTQSFDRVTGEYLIGKGWEKVVDAKSKTSGKKTTAEQGDLTSSKDTTKK